VEFLKEILSASPVDLTLANSGLLTSVKSTVENSIMSPSINSANGALL
jgi:hypothetical protein